MQTQQQHAEMSFERFMEDSAVQYEPCAGSDRLIIVFGGINQGVGLPVFEFRRSLSEFSCAKLFVRDLGQSWYHGELPGFAADRDDALAKMAALIERGGYRRIVTIGNSMGGYAAIWFGVRLAAAQVLAFAPQTFIGPWLRLWHLDPRWMREILSVYQNALRNRPVLDLKRDLARRRYESKIEIFCGDMCRLDVVHAGRMSKLDGVTVHSIQDTHHDSIKRLRDDGTLRELLSRGLGETPQSEPCGA